MIDRGLGYLVRRSTASDPLMFVLMPWPAERSSFFRSFWVCQQRCFDTELLLRLADEVLLARVARYVRVALAVAHILSAW